MRTIPNDIVQTLLRTFPIILGNVNEENIKKNLRLNNAIRLTRKIVKRLNRIENEQRNSKHSERQRDCSL